MSPSRTPGPKFEYRYYEALRRAALAPALGEVGLAGAQDPELQRLKKRRKVELQSFLAEGLKPEKTRSVIDTHYVIEMRGGQLVADDGEPLEDMLVRAQGENAKLVGQDKFFAEFLPQRTQYELDELHEWEAMARGEKDYNTVITLSPYSEEYDDDSEEVQAKLIRAGQKPYWKRGMFRVTHAQNGQIHIFNYSIDSSSVEIMAGAAKRGLDYEFKAQNSTDMLGERIHRQIDDDSWRFIAPALITAGDNILTERHGGVWKHGYDPKAGVRRVQSFVESQTQIVDSLLSIDEQLTIENSTFGAYNAAFLPKLYDCLALLETRLELGREDEPIIDYHAASSGAGSSARAQGKSYDACGAIIGGAQAGHVGAAGKTGFESLKRLENKKISCYACKKNVVVDKKYLEKGQLHCNQCGYHLDICTGKSSYKKPEKSLTGQVFSTFDIISDWFKKMKRENEIKNAAQKQAKAEIGEKVTYLDVKRHEKQIRQKLAA